MPFRSCWIVLGLAVASCGEANPPPTPVPAANAASADPADAEANDTYSFGLQTRDHQLWLHADSEPRRYTVKSRDGRVLARALDEGGLERDYPELHHLLHNAVDSAEGSADYAGLGYSDDR